MRLWSTVECGCHCEAIDTEICGENITAPHYRTPHTSETEIIHWDPRNYIFHSTRRHDNRTYTVSPIHRFAFDFSGFGTQPRAQHSLSTRSVHSGGEKVSPIVFFSSLCFWRFTYSVRFRLGLLCYLDVATIAQVLVLLLPTLIAAPSGIPFRSIFCTHQMPRNNCG